MVERTIGTLRFRITAATAAVALAVLVVTAYALVANHRDLRREDLDDALRNRVDAVAAVLATTVPDRLPGAGSDREIGVRVVDGEGRTLVESGQIGEEPDDVPALPPPPPGHGVLRTDRDDELRILSRRVAAPEGTVVVHAVGSLEDVEESAEVLERQLRLGVPAATAVVAALTWWLVGWSLRPVEGIRAEVARIGAGDLSRRVPVPPGDDEVGRLARTMNDMLARIEVAAARQRAFVADASHELRTPLTRMRAELEVELAHPDDDPTAVTRSVLEEVANLQRLVDDLLDLAGDEEEGADLRRAEPVDLDDVVLREAARVRAEGGTTVDTAGVSAAQVVGDRDQLGRLVRNLVDNAARHATSRVSLHLGEADGVVRLVVEDDGPGIPPDQRDRVFERFTRLDEARAAGRGGTGLGLAIARAITLRHRGQIRVDPEVGPPGARLEVTLPARPIRPAR